MSAPADISNEDPRATAGHAADAAADARLDELAHAEVEAPVLPSVGDDKAQKEAISLSDGLDLEGKKREHNRHQTFRDHVNTATLAVLWLIVATLLIGIAVFAFHTLTPSSWHFLERDQLSDLKGMLGTAILSSALTGYAKGRMS